MTVPASAKATYVGLGTSISTGRGSDYAALSRLIRQDGLLNRRPGYYATKICVMAVLYIAGWAAVAALGASWYQLLAAVYLAVVFGQLAFVGHEAGHRQIFRSRRGNDAAGLLLGDLLIGLNFGW
jgi:fatty acid desaturase